MKFKTSTRNLSLLNLQPNELLVIGNVLEEEQDRKEELENINREEQEKIEGNVQENINKQVTYSLPPIITDWLETLDKNETVEWGQVGKITMKTRKEMKEKEMEMKQININLMVVGLGKIKELDSDNLEMVAMEIAIALKRMTCKNNSNLKKIYIDCDSMVGLYHSPNFTIAQYSEIPRLLEQGFSSMKQLPVQEIEFLFNDVRLLSFSI